MVHMQINGLRFMMVGGASGMGRATAERVAAGGGKVAILDRDGSAGAEVAAAIGATFHPCNIVDFEGTEAVVNEAVDALGGLDAAAITAGGGTAARTIGKDGPHDLDAFRSVIDLNLIGTFNLNRLQAWHMSKNEPNDDGERGVIINTASIAAFEGQIGQVAYTASKAAIAGMALVMARDLGSMGIRVNAIAPSLFDTGITAGIPEDYKDVLVKDSAFPKRMGHPHEYAMLATAIIENPMLNGGTIRLDAGQRFAPK
jgi:NAD(P)-dependent dehydrogenase (short-subunit alcohol dehydrogenase family)